MSNDVNIRFTAEDVASEVVRRLGGNLGDLKSKVDPLNAAWGALGATLTAGAVVAAFKNTVDALDRLGDAAEEAGVTVEALSGLRYAATFAGQAGEVLDKALIKLNTRLSDAASGGKESAELFRVLGINVKDSAGDILSSDAALAQLADRFASYRDGAEKSALAAQIFGEKVGPKLLPLLNQGSEGLERLREEAERLGIAVSGDRVRQAQQFNDQLDRVAQGFAALRNNIAASVLPTLIRLLDEFERGTRIFGSFGDALLEIGLKTNPFASLGANIQATQQKIEALRIEQNRFRDEFGQDTDGGFNRRQLAGEIALLEKRLQYLKETQAARALEGSGGVLDANDARAARGGGRAAVPRLRTEDPEAAKKAEEDYRRIIEINRQVTAGRLESLGAEEKVNAARVKSGEQAAAIEQATLDAVLRRVQGVQQALASQEELENARYTRQLESLVLGAEEGLLLEQEYQSLREEAERQHQERLTAIRDAEEARRLGVAKVYRKLDLQAASGFLAQMSGLMNSNSRKLFEVGKAAAISETVISTYRAATGAYAALASIPYVGPVLGAAAAAAAIASGIANVQRIKSTPFGGSGVAGSVPGSAVATPGQGPFDVPGGGTPTPAQPQVLRPAAQINLTVQGSWFSAEDVRRLIGDINGQLGLGATVEPA